MAAADPKLNALLELERRGKLGPEAAKMLEAYRAQGTAKRPAAQQDANRFETAKNRDEARAVMDRIGNIERQMGRVNTLYDQNLKGSGPMKSLQEYFPSQGNRQFDSAVALLKQMYRQVSRTPGEGAMSDFESKLAMLPLPDRMQWDGGNEESISGINNFLTDYKASLGKRIGLPTPPPAKKQAPRNISLDENGKIIP